MNQNIESAGETIFMPIMSLMSLPPEILRMIAMNLHYHDLYRLQNSVPRVLAATEDVSFYCEYFKQNYPKFAIQLVYSKPFYIRNWEKIIERLYDDLSEFAYFIYETRTCRSFFQALFVSPTIGCEIERLGEEIGAIFADIYCRGDSSMNRITIDELHKSVNEHRETNADLVKTKYWAAIEEVFFVDVMEYASFFGPQTKGDEGWGYWLARLLQFLDFAKEKSTRY